jgi:aromatic amino acid aminotransferase I / 2-aminoadipate transaminase
MFFWVKIRAPDKYPFKRDMERRVFERCLREKVLVIPGGYFLAEGDPEGGSMDCGNGVCYFRGTFAAAEEDLMEQGIERLGKSICAEFSL